MEAMEQIILHGMTSILTVAVWTILSGDLGQAAGVTILYWMIFWAVAEIEERWKNDLDRRRERGERTENGGCPESRRSCKRNQKTA